MTLFGFSPGVRRARFSNPEIVLATVQWTSARVPNAFLRELIRRATGPVRSVPKAGIPQRTPRFSRSTEDDSRRLERSAQASCSTDGRAPFLAVARPKARSSLGAERWHRVILTHFRRLLHQDTSSSPGIPTVRVIDEDRMPAKRKVRHRTAKNFQLDLFSPDDRLLRVLSRTATKVCMTAHSSSTPLVLRVILDAKAAKRKPLAELPCQFDSSTSCPLKTMPPIAPGNS